MLISDVQADDRVKIQSVKELSLVKIEGSRAFYEIEFSPERPGVLNYGLRMYPKNELLPHRQDFAFVKWI